MTWVKVCGLRRPEEVGAAISAGADAVGFVSVPGSPRYVDLDEVRLLASGVGAMRVLLTADLTPAGLVAALRRTGVDAAQPYGLDRIEAAKAAMEAGYSVLFPVRVGERGSVADPPSGTIPLFDTRGRGSYGGTGETFDWSILAEREEEYVVAGGLGPDNVARLVASLHPWGVDASSRLESAPGVKDLGKVSAFVEEAKKA